MNNLKHKKYLFICLIFSNMFFCIGQQSSSIYKTAPYNTVSIYEIGEPVANCDMNMKNLLGNWKTDKIVNAKEYEFLDWSSVETIEDSTRYVYYRNYFSGTEPVYSSVTRKGGYIYKNGIGIEYDSLWIYPGFLYTDIYDTRGLSNEARALYSEDFRQKAKNVISKELNIDTMKLSYHSFHRTDSMESIETKGGFNIYSKSAGSFSHNAASPTDSLSQNYIDVNMTRERSYDDLSMEETRKLMLEELFISRIGRQITFNDRVKIGDKVFMIKFKHKDKFYNNFIICSSETNKVVMDYFFLGITFKQEL